MFTASYFGRLARAATKIVGHPDFPEKRQILDRCRDEVAELIDSGRIGQAEGQVLLAILDGNTSGELLLGFVQYA